ncbi:MAG: ATP-binding protein [Sedimentisphaerales bacterium]|nr:ATP-binding protein [Sedimentisphaerales bacterium]
MIERNLAPQLSQAAKKFPVVTLTGPRQSGKSTLCRMCFPNHAYVNLEAPDVRAFAQEDPRRFLAEYPQGAILDEIQRCPELPSYLQGIIDEDATPGKWILTGSQNLTMLSSVSQSLAGRTAMMNLLPLVYPEIQRFPAPPHTLDTLLLTGGYPRIYDQNIAPDQWLGAYMATYIERDVRTISNVADLAVFQRFVELCAGRTGQLLNLSALASDAGIAQPTAKAWISILEASYIVLRLPSFSRNLAKRLVKMPKLYFYDTGLACWLLGIRKPEHLRHHPLRGALFETWVVTEIIKHRANQLQRSGVFFYRDRYGGEADIIVELGDRFILAEIKAGQTITGDTTGNIHKIRKELQHILPAECIIIYGGETSQSRGDINIVPWRQIDSQIWV